LSFVSGANGRAAKPNKNTGHKVIPAYRIALGPWYTRLVSKPRLNGLTAATSRPAL
jgi:hypothetical protein